jgi:subtilisin family serine protease
MLKQMKAIIKSILTSFLTLILCSNIYSQAYLSIDSLDKRHIDWQNKDPKKDKVPGTSADLAYKELLKNKSHKKKVVVAVIDSGVDIEHEDLQGKIWTNTNEIPGNGIDDDGNGYIDDIHGWNFLGNATGEIYSYEALEQTRVVRKYQPIFRDVKSENELSADKVDEYKLYLACKKEFESELEKHQKRSKDIEAFEKALDTAEGFIKEYLGKQNFTPKDVENINTKNNQLEWAKNFLLPRYKQGFTRAGFQEWKDYNLLYLEKHLNLDFNPRVIIGDNIEDINDRNYGNNNVKGDRSDHGTLVAGFIAANRNNGIGINGIAEHVEIMTLRAVPNGDEMDKDVALSIIYAVDNGAHIINLSFGKDFSPQKKMVEEAIKYAEKKNVLIIHAAGNSSLNIDNTERFPSNRFSDNTYASNWLNVGASSIKADKKLAADFSNYGKQNVHFFAPGARVISTHPNNQYQITDGTSFASPVASGVAALILSHFPELSAVELKNILIESSFSFGKLKVYPPGSIDKKKVPFSSLSHTGGIVNAYQALILAEKHLQENKH